MRRALAALAAGLAGAAGLALAAAASPIARDAAGTDALEASGEGTLELVREPASPPPAEEVLRAAVSRLNCAAMQPRPQARAGAPSDWFDPPPRPELYTSNVALARLREIAAELVGSAPPGGPDAALSGTLADQSGVPPAVAVAGWGSAAAPRLVFIPRSETPLDIDFDVDLRGAGILVVEGDLRVWSRLDYTGLLLVLGSLAVMDGGSLTLDGIPLFAETLVVYSRGNLRVSAGGDRTLDVIRRTLSRRKTQLRLPIPQIEQSQAPVEEPSCDL